DPASSWPVRYHDNQRTADVSAPFEYHLADTFAPTLALPGDITAEATSAAGATVTFTATATDAVDGDVAVTCTPASGSTFPIGATTVTCTATDASDNTAAGTFAV